MTREELTLARLMFRLKIHEAKGQAFEDLFVKIYQSASPTFKAVKPQGQIGDRKNDGYDTATGAYHQVYAPEKLSESVAEAVKKLKTDFAGIKANWEKICPIRSFYFVMNDRYMGSFPTIEEDLSNIKKDNNLDACEALLAKDLEDKLFSLSEDLIFSIVGFVPSPDKIETLNYSVLNQVVAHIIAYNRLTPVAGLLEVPDYEEKIKVNNLSRRVAALLWSAGNQVGIFDNYFVKNSVSSKQDVRDHLNQIYQTSKKKSWPDKSDGLTHEDYVFMDVLHTAAPKQTQEYIDATLVVMAAFFESCDIFEEPGQTALKL